MCAHRYDKSITSTHGRTALLAASNGRALTLETVPPKWKKKKNRKKMFHLQIKRNDVHVFSLVCQVSSERQFSHTGTARSSDHPRDAPFPSRGD